MINLASIPTLLSKPS
jgi:hypothetical protein